MKDFFSHTCVQTDNTTLPKPVLELLRATADRFDNLKKMLIISIAGTQMVQGYPELLEKVNKILAKFNVKVAAPQSEDSPSIEEIRARAEFAAVDLAGGHPILHAQALTALWSLLEIFVEDLLVTLILTEPDFLKLEIFSKVKVPLSEFELLDKEERARYLIGELERQVAAGRTGADRFERLLEPFGLSGPVKEETARLLRAFHHLRNVIVHRGSIVDRKLVQACPWLNLKIGDAVVITRF